MYANMTLAFERCCVYVLQGFVWELNGFVLNALLKFSFLCIKLTCLAFLSRCLRPF